MIEENTDNSTQTFKDENTTENLDEMKPKGGRFFL